MNTFFFLSNVFSTGLSFQESPLKNATHYWSLKEIIDKSSSHDANKQPYRVRFINNVDIGKHQQLGTILKLGMES